MFPEGRMSLRIQGKAQVFVTAECRLDRLFSQNVAELGVGPCEPRESRVYL